MTTTPNEPVQDPNVIPTEDPERPGQDPSSPEEPHGDPLMEPTDAEPGQMPDHDTEVGA